jgi:hypothetical protein
MAERGQCLLSCIPVRSEAKSQAEIVTQLLYGETYEVLERTSDWLRIRIDYDGYEGWMSANQYEVVAFSDRVLSKELFRIERSSEGICVPLGGEISDLNRGEEEELEVQDIAKKFLGVPYLWGGKTFMGIDCSGFMQVIHKVAGIKLARDASQQVTCGAEVPFGQQKAGDLAFFISKSGNINHVGLLLGPDSIIHASGKVRVDTITEEGILLPSGEYSHDFHSFRRL